MSLLSWRTFVIVIICSTLFILLARIVSINQPQHYLIDDPHSECYQKIQESRGYLVSEGVNFSCEALETPGCQLRFAK